MALPKIPKFKPLADAPEAKKKIVKPVLLGVLVLLLGAFGLEASNNDWDLDKLLSGSSLEEAKVMRDKEGNVVSSGGKYTDEYNCDDFETQEQAQRFFVNAGGPSKDTNRLDGDKDGIACESLPSAKDLEFQENSEPKSDLELVTCTKDENCVRVDSDCCGCERGGMSKAINRKFLTYWNRKMREECEGRQTICLTVSYICPPPYAKCIGGKCNLVENK